MAFGIATLVSRRLGGWLGWLALLVGTAGTVIGVLLAVLGPTALTVNLLLPPTGAAATITFVAFGLTARRLRATGTPATNPTTGQPRTTPTD